MPEKLVIRDSVGSGWLVFSRPLDVLVAEDPADVLATLVEAERRVNDESLFAAGFVSYEAASGFDPAFKTHIGNRLPLVCFGLFSDFQRVDELAEPGAETSVGSMWQVITSRSDYIDDLSAIKRQIELGNTYQINYTVRKRAAGISDPWQMFLSTAADAPYAAFVDGGNYAIVSASPELFFRLDGEQLLCKPMKGTAPRGMTAAADFALRDGLRQSDKNRAENVMIADMVRNDMGRVATPGSVAASELCAIEKYPTVWQMTSTVSANTKASLAEIFGALFPSASITGAPKVSSMAIIADLEDTPREIYTGAIGYMAPGRQAQFSVAIRTALVDRKTDEAVYGVGGGIVWDSDPDEEYAECLTKARILSRPKLTPFHLLETILWEPQDGYFLLDRHLQRMAASADYFDFAFCQEEIRAALDGLAGQLPVQQHRVRLLLHRSGSTETSASPLLAGGKQGSRRISFAAAPVDTDNPFVYHKTTRREVYEQALATSGSSDDVLLWNADGYITETSVANVIVSLDGERCTPPVACGLLAGTYRDYLLNRCDIREQKIHVSELSTESEVMLINSVRREYSATLCGAWPEI